MGRRGKGKGSRGGSEDRVRGRVKQRVQGQRVQGRVGLGGQGGGGRKRGSSFDVGDIEDYAKRLSGKGGGGTSALAGAASGLAGGGLASKFLSGGSSQGSDEEFRAEILDQLSLMDERLQRLEEQMNELLGGVEGDPTEPESTADPDTNP